ncbi:MAG: hypothetical protein JJLCMIEE_02342 [Acidimicrobiales bacterium]|nr:MAG: S9 family peptidase [Actinomycetota bacterium]MBV6509273.1 hypothetical protein [Acidimicrobiales bacterium]RIK03999.1 MAG: peptidase [Acidobacteriota bacterium]
MTAILPYGSWPSPISADVVVSSAISLGEVHATPTAVYWSELRPDEGGRVQIVRQPVVSDSFTTRKGHSSTTVGAEKWLNPEDMLPTGFSARTRVHEYGGGAWWVHPAPVTSDTGDVVYFANWDDQRLYRLDPGGEPVPITVPSTEQIGLRHADGVVTGDGRWIICVREVHTGEDEAVNELVAVPTGGGDAVGLLEGPDFVSFPRLDHVSSRLCWTQWDHPAMPWDATELWVATFDTSGEVPVLRDARQVAGGTAESVFQPQWSPEGVLHFVSDRTGWWNIHRFPGPGMPAGDPVAVTAFAGEVGTPQWVFGMSRYAFAPGGRIVCAYSKDGTDHLAVVQAGDGEVRDIETGFTHISGVTQRQAMTLGVMASPSREPAVVSLCAVGAELGPPIVHRPPRDLGLDPRWFSSPEPIAFPTGGGRTAHAMFYRPTNPDVAGPAAEQPPLLVLIHGGPTSQARVMLSLGLQYWTSRGFAVVDVNYRGSTGYGRPYRELLNGQWGIADVEDCVAVARYLAEQGLVDPGRLLIRGGSAGGFTTLAALAFHDTFAAGASSYGVADLEALAKETHKFESRYLDSLIGPYPEDSDAYTERSPIHHVEGLDRPLIIFQGLEDEVVPPEQAEMMVAALRERSVPYAYIAFEGEQHGFRRAENIKRVLEAELSFYSQVFGFGLADDIEPVAVENL